MQSNVFWQELKNQAYTLGLPMVGEGLAMLVCSLPSLLIGDSRGWWMMASALLVIVLGLFVVRSRGRRGHGHAQMSVAVSDSRVSYVVVCLVWVLLSMLGTLPFLLMTDCRFTDAFFESMSGLTSTGATVFSDVESLPSSLLLWRSVTQWLGGFGIILLVLAIVPTLGINKYSLYTAEASGADNTGRTTTTMRTTVRRTLVVYLLLTVLFVVLLRLTGMTLWESVNITFTNISTGGFSIYGDSIVRFTATQQYILAVAMFLGGVNFALLYNFFTFRWRKLRYKLDQFGFYLLMLLVSVAFVVLVLALHDGMAWEDALRCGVVQTCSVLTTTGSVVADTNAWWTPVLLLFLLLCFCGGMAGSTTGGVKTMRVLIMLRYIRCMIFGRMHPNAYYPVRLNRMPVGSRMVSNVMVIFVVFVVTIFFGILMLMLSGVGAAESVGAVLGCLTGYGPGLGECGGFGNYAAFPVVAKWICSLLMLLGRLECITVIVLFVPGFWRGMRR